MNSYCRNCGYDFVKSYAEYYKVIMSMGFPMCINCRECVDCCHTVCQCTRCSDCYEVIDICKCDNDPELYSNPCNAFTGNYIPLSKDKVTLNYLTNRFNNFVIHETPIIEEVYNYSTDYLVSHVDLMDLDDEYEMQ
ncbi:hypothetical protein QKU48_gp0998 [Fadolivirus algeromassiliense]|jgi:hypothetical protein|uniref:Uncharacterized protein n=1 Tax=Fadolivirus FV1/VV64 TaxID=3070911 RepID=A0A7D3V7V3_9VIRU|nr:hypothetical protein QKU48_gp0998 [Fadolivirus algeromassiliense]QKF94456.1 hypothetical protein Fadolivirus_1_998 [Fadolivirus FV1/VV64]